MKTTQKVITTPKNTRPHPVPNASLPRDGGSAVAR